MSNLIELTESNFDAEALKADVPVLVDFWAPWCGPCRMITPVLEELSVDNGDAVKIVKINIDDCPNLAATYSVSSIPTLLLFKGGEIADTFVGIQQKSRLQEAIDQASE